MLLATSPHNQPNPICPLQTHQPRVLQQGAPKTVQQSYALPTPRHEHDQRRSNIAPSAPSPRLSSISLSCSSRRNASHPRSDMPLPMTFRPFLQPPLRRVRRAQAIHSTITTTTLTAAIIPGPVQPLKRHSTHLPTSSPSRAIRHSIHILSSPSLPPYAPLPPPALVHHPERPRPPLPPLTKALKRTLGHRHRTPLPPPADTRSRTPPTFSVTVMEPGR